MNFVCHSGGCPGADMAWEKAGEEYGVITYAYSFSGHTQYGKNPVVLSIAELDESFTHVQIAAQTLKRPVDKLPNYIRNLICRNWFQVKNGTAIFSVGRFANRTKTLVDGGTGWAVQMAVDNIKPVFFYDQESKLWYQYNYDSSVFEEFNDIPLLTVHFAGIGTRDITDDGIQAILNVYKHTFSNLN